MKVSCPWFDKMIARFRKPVVREDIVIMEEEYEFARMAMNNNEVKHNDHKSLSTFEKHMVIHRKAMALVMESHIRSRLLKCEDFAAKFRVDGWDAYIGDQLFIQNWAAPTHHFNRTIYGM